MPRDAPYYRPPRARGRKEFRRRTDGQWYASARWRRLRALILRDRPLCEDPLGEHRRRHRIPPPATDVHHRRPRSEAPELALDPGNLMALCRRCHNLLEPRGAADRASRSSAY